MNLSETIISLTQQAIVALFNTEVPESSIALQDTRKEFVGEVTIVTFPFIKFSKKSPEETGAMIGEYLTANTELVTGYSTVKGFLNLSIASSYWLSSLAEINTTLHFGKGPTKNSKVMVEYSSPNTNKPLHLGHVRNNLLGYSVAELLKYAGYEVIKANLVNDRGIHICKSMLAWEKFGNGETPESTGMKGDHLVGKYYVEFDKAYKKEIEHLIAQGLTEEQAKKEAPMIKEAQDMLLKWEQKDEHVLKLWKMMNDWVYAGFAVTYKSMGVDFDQYYYESNTYNLGKDIIDEGLAKGVFFKKEDGSVWIDLTDDGLDQKLVLRGDGTSVYITQDIGTAQMKYEQYQMDASLYVVGNEQEYHFKVLFLILEKLGKTWAKGLFHLSYGMVDLPSGKMKSREGTVVDADDLIAEMIQSAKEQSEALGKVSEFEEAEKENLYRMIGMGALKYYLLKVDPKKRLLFDPNESIDLQGHTGPFIQYSYARVQSILRKANVNIDTKILVDDLNANEKECIMLMLKYPIIIEDSAKAYSPALLSNYLYELAKTFNKFYHDDPILKVEDEQRLQFRLMICQTTSRIVATGMALLGIEVPERM
ncbi:MAG: arginine--tRNA ligase [Sphingobacteriales bacterium]|nr:arginine--tRNA ligase [Sphingobacteriales bacterium]